MAEEIVSENDQPDGGDLPPPSYTTVTDEGNQRNDAILLAPGFNPFLGMKKQESKSIMEQLGEVDIPFNFDIAKKSMVSTMSTLYATMLIVTCVVFVSTEVVTISVPVDYFESKGFYTFLYSGSIMFMCYIFFYVLRVKFQDMIPSAAQKGLIM